MTTPIRGLMATLAVLVTTAPGGAAAERPNLVFILCDDLGFGDVRCLNPRGKIPTPHIDRLATEGMIFTDAHSSSSVCTPTRYGLLTGRYNWRSRLKSGVLSGTSPSLIEPGRLTVAAFLRQQGYYTACIGKWHLGLDWAIKKPGGPDAGENGRTAGAWHLDYTRPIAHGPTTVGFDEFFGISASLDMPPFTFITNDHVVAVPTVEKQWVRKGAAAPDFEAVDVLPTLTARAVEYIQRRAIAAKAGQPFFLYLAFASPHTPIVPSPEWRGRSGLSDYGDFVMQTDDSVGRVLAALETNGLVANTLVIFTSDNGCSPAADIAGMQRKGHEPSYVFRGAKADIFDGGHRIPFIVRWPGRVRAGSSSDQLVCLNDFFATCADILGVPLPYNSAEDSVSLRSILLGTARGPVREALVHHSIDGSFAIRQGPWKLNLCAGSGGWSAPRPGSAQEKLLPPVQLYDLRTNLGETNNLQAAHPDIVARLTRLLERYVADGRSTPGPPQTNTTPVSVFPRTTKAPAGQRAQ